MEIKQSYLAMIREFPGGWDAMAGALGMSRCALENRIYERKGQSILVDTALQMQAFSRSTLFAEAIARRSGGVFVETPSPDCNHRDDILEKFTALYSELGDLSREFSIAIKDHKIDARERDDLEGIAARIQATLAQLLVLTFQVYCPTPAAGGVEP